MKKLTSTTILISISVVGIIISSILLIFFDQIISLKNQKEQKNSIAKLTSIENLVQKKRSNQLGWEKAFSGDELYLKDQIYTYEEAGAELIFDKSSQIKLGSSSLLKIDKQNENVAFDFLQGQFLVKVNEDSKAKIQSNGQEINIAKTKGNTELMLSQTKDSQNITLLSGKASMKVGAKEIKLNSGQQLEVDSKQGKFAVKDLEIKLLNPKPQEDVLISGKKEVTFTWETNKKVDHFEVTLSKDLKMEKVVEKFQTKEKQIILNKFQLEGSYYWRVLGVDLSSNEKYQSAVYNFNIKFDVGPKLYRPYDREEFLVATHEADTYFEWSNLNAEKYELVLTETKTQKIVKQIELNDNRVYINLDKGVYQWKVRAIDSSRPNSPYSNPSGFSIISTTEMKPYELNVNLKFVPDKKIVNEQQAFFTWKYDVPESNSVNNQFLLEVSTDDKFDKIIHNEKTTSTKYTWTNPYFGQFYWRVIPIVKDQVVYERSSSFTLFSHFLKSPKLNEIERVSKIGKFDVINIGWEDISDYNDDKITYHVEISDTEDFSNIILDKNIEKNSIEFNFNKPGNYFVRVKFIIDKAESNYSEVKSFELKSPELPPVQGPPTLSPEYKFEIIEGFNFKHQTFSDQINLTFSAPERGATNMLSKRSTLITLPKISPNQKYLIEIYEDPSATKLLHQVQFEGNTYRWAKAQEGTYYLRSALIDEYGRQSIFSNMSKVTVVDPFRIAKELAEKKALAEKLELERKEAEERLIEEKKRAEELEKERLAELEKKRLEAIELEKAREQKLRDDAIEDELKKSWLALDFSNLNLGLGIESVSVTSKGTGANESGSLNYLKSYPRGSLLIAYNSKFATMLSFKIGIVRLEVTQVDNSVKSLSFTEWGGGLSELYFINKRFLIEAQFNFEQDIFVDRKLTNGAQSALIPGFLLGLDGKIVDLFNNKYGLYVGPKYEYLFSGTGSGFKVKSGSLYGAHVKARPLDFEKGFEFNLEFQKVKQNTSVSSQDETKLIGEIAYSFGDIF